MNKEQKEDQLCSELLGDHDTLLTATRDENGQVNVYFKGKDKDSTNIYNLIDTIACLVAWSRNAAVANDIMTEGEYWDDLYESIDGVYDSVYDAPAEKTKKEKAAERKRLKAAAKKEARGNVIPFPAKK